MTAITLTKRVGRVIRLILLISLIVILRYSSSGAVFSKMPLVTAKWEIGSPDNNHLGRPIKATLRITTHPGVTVDTSKLPDKGDILPLPPKLDTTSSTAYFHYDIPSEIPEGELEVISRRITQYSEDGLIITEINYELQYLLPLDLSNPVDDKRLPWDVPIFQSYQRFFVSTGKIDWLTTKILVEMTNFYIVPRVNENSRPIFALFNLTPPATHWPYVRLAGAGLLAISLGILILRGVKLVRKNRLQSQPQDVPPTASDLYQQWRMDPNPETFVEAIKLYRRGIWGKPKPTMWFTTTFILYSGISLTLEQMGKVFSRLVKEVSDEPSP